MILRRLVARGFMRYEHLELGPLPARGLVAIVGANESGKSTIGEAISFALFGETVKSRATDLSQVVSWDAERAEVVLEIDAGRGGILKIERTADRRGLHQACLRGAGGEVLAEGPAEVAAAVRSRFGLGFQEFRASMYLAQGELRALLPAGVQPEAGEDGAGMVAGAAGRAEGGPAAVEEILGLGVLRRAAAEVRAGLPRQTARRDELERELAIARALLETYGAEPEAEDGLRAEIEELEREYESADALLPHARERLQALERAVRARGAVGEAFARLERALAARRAAREADRLGTRLAALVRGLAEERERLEREIAHAGRQLEQARQRIDRLIDYQQRMAELQARLDLYAAEVRRRLEAPEVAEEDLVALEGLAMPATPAAALRLAEVRAARLRRSRNRALGRMAIFALLALLFLLVGGPALMEVLPPRELRPAEGLSRVVGQAVRALAEAGSLRERRLWVALAVGGCGGGVLFAVLALLQLRAARQRHELLDLAREGRARLEEEVRALSAEHEVLGELDLRRPLEFAERVRRLRNAELREAFEQIRELYNDLMSEPVQRAELLRRERALEAHRRDALAALQERRIRCERLLALLPRPGEGCLPAEVEPAGVPEALESLESEALRLLDAYERARRCLEQHERLAEGAVPAEQLGQLQAELEAVAAALRSAGEAGGTAGPAAGAAAGPGGRGGAEAAALRRFVAEQELAELVREPEAVPLAELQQRLGEQAALLQRLLPPAAALLAEREAAERALGEVLARQQRAAARLQMLRGRLAESERRRRARQECELRIQALERELGPLQHEIQVRELAYELLQECAAQLRRRLGPMLGRFVAAVLPRLTGGRYRRVRVLPGLELRVYSPDKNDFVPLVDLSAGAADQLLLVLRLAVSAALARARGPAEGQRFLFLDEPLASSDEERAQWFLQILEELQPLFPQVFLVAHLPLRGMAHRFALVVPTEVGQRTLRVGLAEGEPAAGATAKATAGGTG